MAYLGTQPNDVKKNTGLYTPSEILQLTKDGSWGGSLELIEEKTISAVSSAIFTDINENVFDVHFMTLDNITFSNDSVSVRFRFFESGVEETASVYQEAHQQMFTSAFAESRSTALSYIDGTFNTGNATNESANAYHYFYNLGNSAKYSFTTGQINIINNSGIFGAFFGGGVLPQASIVDQIKLFVSSGTFSGTAKLYGVKQI